MDADLFTSLHWLNPRRERIAAEIAMDLAERGDPDLAMRIVHAAEAWSRYHLHQAWAEVYEGPAEFPTIYPNNLFGYRVCLKMPNYPHGTWIDVLVAADGTIVDANHVNSRPAEWYCD
jgi:hypothetical protein